MYIFIVFIFCVASNSFSAAENNAHNTISRDEFEQMKNVMRMLQDKVQIQETRIVDLEKEIEVLKNGDEGSSKRIDNDGGSETGGRSETTEIPLTQTPE